MATPAEILALMKRKAMAYALANGGSEADGAAFGDTLGGISWVESSLGQQPVGDGNMSHGLFHTHLGGRNLSGIGQRAGSAQQLAAILSDPNVDIDNSMPELWQHFRQHGGAAGYQRDPGGFVANVALTGQRPDRGAWNTVVRSGGYAKGVEIARGAPAPVSGSPLQSAAGLRSQAENVSASVARAPAVSVNRTPVQGQMTSLFGTPFPMDSGATYQGQQYPHFNKGVDYGAPGGSPVSAVVGGTVKLAADDGSGWGPRVVITDAEGYDHSYGHLDPNSIRHLRPGMTVEAGLELGKVAAGNVGTSTGPHLSYDIFKDGEPVDPTPWLGEGVRAKGIPAGQRAPSYLSGATPGGAGSMVQLSQQQNTFYQDQLAAAQAEYQKVIDREQAILAKGQGASAEEKAELARIQGNAAAEIPGTRDLAIARVFEIQKAINDLPKGAAGASPQEQAAAVAGIRAQQNEHNRWLADTFIGLIDSTFKNQLGVANVMSQIMQANEANIRAAVESRVRRHEISSADAVNIVQAESMKQAAEAARFGQAMALAGMINENDWKIAERQLPEGQNFVPMLGPDDPMAQVLGRLNIQFPGIAVRQTDFSKLDMRQSMADADAIVPQTVPLSIDNLRSQYAASKELPVYTPNMITAEGIGLPNAPDMTALAPGLPQMSGAGGMDDEDLINRILERGPYAPPPQTTVAGNRPTPPASGPTSLGGADQASPTRVLEPGDAQGTRGPQGQTPMTAQPSTGAPERRLTGTSDIQQAGRILSEGGSAVLTSPIALGASAVAQGAEALGIDPEVDDIADIFRKLGFGAKKKAETAARAPVISGVVGGVQQARRWLR